jgi:TonB family protein
MRGAKRIIVALRFFLLPLLLLIAHPIFAQTGDAVLEAHAIKLADSIGKSLPFPPSKDLPETYIVFDFQDLHGETTQLGIHLADELSEALRDRIVGLKPVARSKLRELVERDRIDPAAFQSKRVAHWGARILEANLAIIGTIEAGTGDIELQIHVVAGNPKKRTAEQSMRLSWTEDRRVWQAQSVPHFPALSSWKDVPIAGKDGYSAPHCAHCGQPEYPEAARKARMQGKAKARTLVGEDGHVREVVLLEGLPCGLSPLVVSALKNWVFQPISGPDGKPVTVQVPVEVSFRLE